MNPAASGANDPIAEPPANISAVADPSEPLSIWSIAAAVMIGITEKKNSPSTPINTVIGTPESNTRNRKMITAIALMADAITGSMERFDLWAGMKHFRIPGSQWVGNQIIALGMMYYKLMDRL